MLQINSPALLGILRGVGFAAILAVLSYLGDATHLALLGNPFIETAIATIALAFEHGLENKTGKALFGAVKTKASL